MISINRTDDSRIIEGSHGPLPEARHAYIVLWRQSNYGMRTVEWKNCSRKLHFKQSILLSSGPEKLIIYIPKTSGNYRELIFSKHLDEGKNY